MSATATEVRYSELARDVHAIRIAAFDPGGTTGYCVAEYYGNKLDIIVVQKRLTPLELLDLIDGLTLFASSPIHVIYEDFQYRNAPRPGLDLTPVKLIGVIELAQEKYCAVAEFYKQSAATGKAFFTDDRLKELEVYVKGKQHGRDATRHLLHWINFGAGAQWINLNNVDITVSVAENHWIEAKIQ